jgi:hypothetical protein
VRALILSMFALAVAGVAVNLTLYAAHGEAISLIAAAVCAASTVFQGSWIARGLWR